MLLLQEVEVAAPAIKWMKVSTEDKGGNGDADGNTLHIYHTLSCCTYLSCYLC
jgi:hypothetical protein